jgi:crossover junction endodeoxyribonuclease RusA
MTTLLHMEIPGDPVAKGRPRMTRQGRTYTPEKTREAEKALRERLVRTYTDLPVQWPVGVEVIFHCATARRTDGDNLFKLVTDSMNGLVYEDDSQIVEWTCRLYRKSLPARTILRVYSIDDVDATIPG